MNQKHMKKPKIITLHPNHIRIDGGTQSREQINEDTVADYAEAMSSDAEFPPCIVFYDGSSNWLADGFHRYFGAVKAKKRLVVEQREGTRRDAILYSVGANATHGLRRTNADKRKAVLTLLEDADWGTRSDNWIAQQCGVSHPFVGSLREASTCNGYKLREGQDGKVRRLPEREMALSDDVFSDEDEGSIPSNSRPLDDEGDATIASVNARMSRNYSPSNAGDEDDDFADPFEEEAPRSAVVEQPLRRGDEVRFTDAMTGDKVIGYYITSLACKDVHGTIYRATSIERYGPGFNDRPDASEEESSPTPVATPVRDYEKSIEQRAAQAEIIHDTLTPAQEAARDAAPAEPQSDEEWLESLPIYRVLHQKQHKGIVARRALLDWRKVEKAVSAFSRAVASAESVKAHDDNFFARALAAPRTITPPDQWGVCPPCKGAGCARCGRAGFEMNGGIDPRRIEAGEVE